MASSPNWPSDLNLAFVESLWEDYCKDPGSVPDEWRSYFQRLGPDGVASPNGASAPESDARYVARRDAEPAEQPEAPAAAGGAMEPLPAAISLQDRVDKLVRNYRVRGHIIARVDPLGLPRPSPPELDTDYYGLSATEMDQRLSDQTLSGCDLDTPRTIIERLRETYCRSIGVQFMHIDDLAVRAWLQRRMEGTANRLHLSAGRQLRILTRLTDATIFEEFIQKKFVGAKSFSLEGCESLIPLLDLAIERAGDSGANEIVIGMAHRGRLNVLANIMGKSPQQIFREFADVDVDRNSGRGDVKYHLGHSSEWKTARGAHVHLSLAFNPSHLEFVNPVAIGRMRSKQDRNHDTQRKRGLCILIHGDAAFAGEGVVQETLNMSELPGYTVGGTIHIIVNNQIGFTTPPEQGRSMIYASGLAKMLQIPIFHVNGEDPEAVAQVIRLALDFRATFKRDVVIDMYGYRRHGHNEGDEPAFTQPLLYKAIRQRKSVREAYLEHLLTQGDLNREEAERIAEERRKHLEEELSAARSDDYIHTGELATGLWAGYHGGLEDSVEDRDTGVKRERLSRLLDKLSRTPEHFQPDRRIQKLLDGRAAMGRGEQPLDWAAAEAAAFAALLVDGARVRFTGQDVERGTFSHRHAVLRDVELGHSHTPLKKLSPRQAPFEIHNSPLSEAGVLGFEYGYSIDWPDGLILWEAQFGDFVNTAQVIIDQFIAAAEDKWSRLSGLVMLLPHGFEGQGPEHSSARLERFLQLAAEDNIQVCSPTTPAQYFHLLRRQVLKPWRKPMVIMSPKSMLRNAEVVSDLAELTHGRFERILPDPEIEPAKARRILMCSGKIYYELLQQRRESGRDDVAILRLEQLYPLSDARLAERLDPYPQGTELVWVQEEPENMGAWRYLLVRLGGQPFGGHPLRGISRESSASTATGSAASHKVEQQEILDRAFSGL